MPFVKGQPHMGHVLTPEDRAKAHANAAQVMDQKRALKLEDLKDKSGAMLSEIFEYLMEVEPATGKTRMWRLMGESKLKDIGVLYGISTEKFLLTQGQPTTIMAHQEQRTADELFNAVMQEAKRRGLVKRPIEVVGVSSAPQSS